MKKLLYALLVPLALMSFASCSNPKTPSHEVRWSGGGKDSAVYVTTYDQNGNMQNFWMNYLIFNSLMNRGGYTSVNNYYHSHPTEFNHNNYRGYSASNIPYHRASSVSTPSKSYSSSSSSKSYSSPSRSYSSPSRSYSSPSRSYSSPSRSYSSPSRSYSSPSRSYSSPSRR